MIKETMLLELLLPLLQITAQLPDPGQVMEKCRDLTITGSMRANLRLTITEKNGSVRNRTIAMTTKSFAGGLEKRIVRFLEPPEVKGTAMLIIDNKNSADEMWIHLPALKKTRRIVATEKGKNFMSSEFTNADLTTPPLSDFVSRHLEGSGKSGQWIIESIPANDDIADEYGFSKKISYIQTGSYQINRTEFCDFEDKIFKVLEIKEIHPLPQGRYMVKDMVTNNLANGRKSEIVFTNISEGIAIEDSFFSVQNLER